MNTDNDHRDDMMEQFVLYVKCSIISLIVFLFVLLLSSCKTRAVVIETTRTDTCYISKHQRDSIWLHDSIHVTEKQSGDTVYLLSERWHTKYIETTTHDTTYIATHDTIPQPYPVPEYVEKQLSWWQQVLIWLGTVALIIIIAYIGWQAFKLWRTLHPV